MSAYLTPQELIEKYPDLRNKLQWSPDFISMFLRCKLVNGYYNRNKRVCFIEEASLIRVIGFINSGFEENKAGLINRS